MRHMPPDDFGNELFADAMPSVATARAWALFVYETHPKFFDTYWRRASFYDRPILDVLLAQGDMTGPQCFAAIGIGSRTSVERVLHSMNARGLVHIAKFERSEDGPAKAFWRAGPGFNAKKPRPFSKRESSRRHRRKLKREDPIEYQMRIRRNNLRVRKPPAARPDIAAAWIS